MRSFVPTLSGRRAATERSFVTHVCDIYMHSQTHTHVSLDTTVRFVAFGKTISTFSRTTHFPTALQERERESRDGRRWSRGNYTLTVPTFASTNVIESFHDIPRERICNPLRRESISRKTHIWERK